MIRPGDPSDWENEVHQVLKPAERRIVESALKNFPGGCFDPDDMVRVEAAKTHRSAKLWMNRLEHRGLLERQLGGRRFYWYVTEYGRWMMGER